MTTLTTLMLIIGMLTAVAATAMWRTAVTDNDTYNLRSAARIATAGRWTATTAILLSLGAGHRPALPMLVLLLAAATAAAVSRETKTGTTPQTPRHA